MKLAPYLKALYAAAVAGLGGLEIAATDGQFTARELIHCALLTVTAFGVTWGVPNVKITRDPATGRYTRAL